MGEVYQYLVWFCQLVLGYCAFETALIFYRGGKNKSATSRLAKSLKNLKGTDGLILAKKQQLSFKKSCEGVAIIGSTGEHKTSSIIIPNLLSKSLSEGSIVVHDGKGEIYDITADFQRNIGRKVIQFEPLGNKLSYNPLEFCDDLTEVRQLASSILNNGLLTIKLASGGNTGSGDGFWVTAATPLLTSALLYVKELGYPNNNIAMAVKLLINYPIDEIVRMFQQSKDSDIKEQFNMFLKSQQSEATMGSILSTLSSNVQLFTDHKLINNICRSDFKPEMLRKEKITLYIKYEPLKSDYLAPFVAVFYAQLIEKLMYIKGLPIFFILDEFQNMGKISNFVQTVSVCRASDISIMICVQSLSRLYDIYGKNETASILNNLKTKCILPSISDLDTLKYISDLCGYVEITENENGKINKVKKKLFEPDEVRRIEKDKIVIVAHNLFPVYAEQNTWYEQKEYITPQYP